MSKFIVLLSFFAAACYGAPNQGTYCGETPEKIFRCLNLPSVVSREVSAKCQQENECDKMTCVYRELKWLNGGAVDKTRLIAYFDQFVKDHPSWSEAVQHTKTACLGKELNPQGIYLNCPAYDVTHCIFSSFIKHATPSQWSTSADCTYSRAYAGACPVCPSSCYSPQIPIGSCNACYA